MKEDIMNIPFKKPRKIYHAVGPSFPEPPYVIGEIAPSGDGLVYCCVKPEHCIQFVAHNYKAVGKNIITILEIESYRLFKKNMFVGLDHNPSFYHPDTVVICHKGPIKFGYISALLMATI